MARNYTLFWTVTGDPPGGIHVTAEIPASWTENLDGMGSPTFTVPGTDNALVSITAIHAPGASDADRVAWALTQQFDSELPQVTRTPRSDGRLWAVLQVAGRVHARMFLPAPHESIVMAVAMAFSPSTAAWLPSIERVFETVRASAG